MKRIILALLIIAVTLIMPLMGSASDTSLANYKAIVTVSNNSSATTNVAVPFTLNTTALVAAGYIDSACTRVAMTDSTDAKFMPGYGSNPWVVFVPSIGADATVRDSLYTANTSLSSTKYYFPGATGMTASDHISLELGANFAVSMNDTFVNTTINGTILEKYNALKVRTNAGNITASIYTPVWLDVYQGTYTKDTWIEKTFTLNEVNQVRLYMYNTYAGTYAQYAKEIQVWNTVTSAWVSPTGIISSASWSNPSNAYDGNTATYASQAIAQSAWTTNLTLSFDNISSNKLRYYLNNAADSNETLNIDVLTLTPLTVTHAATSSEIDLTISADTTNLTLSINGAAVDSVALGAVTTPDSANNYQFGDDDTTPYIGSMAISVNGTAQGSWDWEYGTTFTDDTGNGHTGTPTFRTTSSDADVSATISSFIALDTATAPSYTVTEQSAFYTGNITATGNFTSTGRPGTGPAVLDVVDDVATAGTVPIPFLWGIIGCFAFASSGLALSYAHKKFAIGGGYVFIMLIVGVIIFGLLIAFKVFDWWMLWFYLIIAGGLAMASRHIDWGGSTSQHSLIGFLAMAWVGLTLINRILEGAFITSAETAYLNTVTFTKAFSLLNLFTIPIMNWDFFTVGIPSLLRWDYSFFGGQAQILQYLMYSITAVVSFIIFGIILGLVYSAITRST